MGGGGRPRGSRDGGRGCRNRTCLADFTGLQSDIAGLDPGTFTCRRTCRKYPCSSTGLIEGAALPECNDKFLCGPMALVFSRSFVCLLCCFLCRSTYNKWLQPVLIFLYRVNGVSRVCLGLLRDPRVRDGARITFTIHPIRREGS